ncbi:MAG: geranylgeranyl reductase family protein [Streptosporangiaceae bacterium]
MPDRDDWDVAVVGAGPAGLAAAKTAVRAGARTVVLERAAHPRYKTCGGGLIGLSLAAVGEGVSLPDRDHINAATFTLRGKHMFTRRRADALLTMVLRDEFDDALRRAAVGAGAVMRKRSVVRSIRQDENAAFARLADGSEVRARVVVGADGSSGVSARHVGAEFSQVDLGLEVEVPVPEAIQREWRGRILIDWGPIPGSYGWVFPKMDRLTVGVIASRGQGERTTEYLRDFIDHLELGSFEPIHFSGHLTRCRTNKSPLRKGRVLVAGDAAGLLEPWTREGISFALRSGALAGTSGAKAAVSRGQEDRNAALDEYVSVVNRVLAPEMDAGRRILAAFSRHPSVVHAALATRPGWRAFSEFCKGEMTFCSVVDRPLIGPSVSFIAKV